MSGAMPLEFSVRGGTLRLEEDGHWSEWIPAGGSTATIRLRWKVDRRGLRLVELRVSDPDGVPAAVLRQIPIATLEEFMTRAATETTAIVEGGPNRSEEAMERLTEAERHVLELYREALLSGFPPAQHVAEELGISPRTVSRHLSKIRQTLLLPTARKSRRE